MDVFLCARCRFLIGTQTGLSHVPNTFGVPCAITNWPSLAMLPWADQDLFVPKLCWSEKDGRFLTFAEVMRSHLGYALFTMPFTREGVRVVDNTPDEITGVVLEMLERQEGTLHYTEEDEALQKRFRDLAEASGVDAVSRVGRAFLRKYAHLLAAA